MKTCGAVLSWAIARVRLSVLVSGLAISGSAFAQNHAIPAYPPQAVEGGAPGVVAPAQPQAGGQRPAFLLQPAGPPPNADVYISPTPAPIPGPPQQQMLGGRPNFIPAAPPQQQMQQNYGYSAPVPVPSATPPQTIVQKIELPFPDAVSAPLNPTPSPIPLTGGQPGDIPNAAPGQQPTAAAPTIVFDADQPGEAGVDNAVPEPTPAPLDPGAMLRERRYAELLPIIESERNSPLASAVGWSLYNANQFEPAKQYFLAAINYDDANYEAAYGLALTLLKQNQYDKAEQVARWRLNEYPQMASILGDIDNQRAVRAYESGDYARALTLYDQVKKYRPLSHNEEIVIAWSYFHQGDYTKSAAEFERLYRLQPDTYAAQGLYASLAKAKDWKKLEALANTLGGPLLPMYQQYVGQRYYSAGLYANALATLPKDFKGSSELEGYTSDTLHGLVFGRYKTGDEGLSQLSEFRSLLGGSMWFWNTSKFTLNVSVVSLFAGSLPKDADVGTVPFEGSTAYQYTPTTSYDALFDFLLSWEAEGFYSPYASIGITPAGALVEPTVIGNFGVRAIQDWGVWSVEAFRDPKKESILSYVGIRDPYTGNSWGRVVESGAKASVYAPIRDNWALSGTILGGFLDGENVEDNGHFMIAGNLTYNFESTAFEYLTLGPSLTYEAYTNNLSYFTYGQGGYFSPQYWVRGTVGSQFMTHQGKRYLLRGSAAVGIQTYNQEASPFFPLGDEDSDAEFAENKATTYTAYVDVEGAVLLGDQFLLGGHVLFNKTGDYTEGWAGLYLRFFFEQRNSIFATDFMQFNRY